MELDDRERRAKDTSGDVTVLDDVDRDVDDAPDGGGSAPTDAQRWAERSRRLALAAFVAYLVVAFFLLLSYGDDRWFVSDEWGFLDGRRLTDPVGLLPPQNGHWSTVPIVVYLVLFRIFGLRSYLPYLGGTIVLHLTLVTLIRVVMRRSGVGPWVATVAAGSFVLFGVGYENMLLGIQISMVGSMVFGFTHWLLADHDGPVDRRDAIGLVAGLLALMSSSIGIPMVIAVGTAVLIRRGWRAALLHTAPLGAIYLVWFGVQSANDNLETFSPPGATALLRWIVSSETGAVEGLAQHRAVAIALGVLLVGGLVLAWLPLSRPEVRRLAGGPIGMLVGGVFLAALIGLQRSGMALVMPEVARSSRYLAMGAAMVLPALGVATATVIRRWRFSAPVVLALFLIGVPGNVAAFDGANEAYGQEFFDQQRVFVVGVANADLAQRVPADVHPNPSEFLTANLTVGFILQAQRDGRLPDVPAPTQAEQDLVTTRLSLAQSLIDAPVPASTCAAHKEPVEIHPERGDRFVLGSPVDVAIRDEAAGRFTIPTTYGARWASGVVTVEVEDATFRLTPPLGTKAFTWCTVP